MTDTPPPPPPLPLEWLAAHTLGLSGVAVYPPALSREPAVSILESVHID
eukprot:COSAG01_NODE_3573_length_5920_cov_3.554372_2_plen_49_part_00